MKETFSVKKQYEFRRAYNKGVRKGGRFLSVIAVPNNKGSSRLGISVSRKFGNSVQRNRFKRLVRESFRTVRSELQGNYDVIVTARFSERSADSPNRKLKAVHVPTFSEVHRDMTRSLRILGILSYDKGSQETTASDTDS